MLMRVRPTSSPESDHLTTSAAFPNLTYSIGDVESQCHHGGDNITCVNDHASKSHLARGWGPVVPNSPVFLGFPDQEAYNRINMAFLDTYKLAKSAIDSLPCGPLTDDTVPPIYSRYFPVSIGDPESDLMYEIVRKVFLTILGPTGFGPAEINNPAYPLQVWWEYNKGSETTYDNKKCTYVEELHAHFQRYETSDEKAIFWIVSIDTIPCVSMLIRA
jgi:hypothetical protein